MGFARGVGLPELIIILVIVVMIFGVGKLSGVGSAMGRAIREFRETATTKSDEGDEGKPEIAMSAEAEEKREGTVT